jgi:sporulation protein YlmC with PRC-barrel domain
MEHGEPGSYMTLEAGTDVVSSDGEVVGEVQHVLADTEEDVFDGLVIDTRLGPGGLRFVDAEQVEDLYEHAAVLAISAEAVEQLPEPTPAPAAMESHGVEDSETPLQSKLRRAWDLISGDY